jgi:hypothetical protein
VTSLLFAAGAAGLAVADESRSEPDVLHRLAGISWLYSDTALRFTCSEAITAVPGGTHHFEYIYVHGPDGKLRDYRTRAGSRSGRAIDIAAARLPRWLAQAYCWAFIFGPKRWSLFRYELQGESEALGRPAFLVRFEPSGPQEKDVNDWYGTAWIDRQTLQLLRVEAQTPESFYQRKAFEKELTVASATPPKSAPAYFYIESVATDFAIEKNGMRFPSDVLIEKSRFRVPGRRGKPFDTTLVYRVRQSYSDYRFFSVRSTEEIRSILSGQPTDTDQPQR